MPLTILEGPAGSGKTHHCLERLRESLRPGARGATYLLAPAQSSYILHEALQQGGPAALIGNPILSFDSHSSSASLAGWLLQGDPVMGGAALGRAEQLLLLKRLVKEQASPAIQQSARTLGFCLEVAALFKEWKEALLSPEEVADAFAGTDGAADPRGLALRDLYARYQAALRAADRWDLEDLQWKALARVDASPGLVAHAHFLVDGFSHFTQWQHGMLRSLARHAASLTVTFPHETGRPGVFHHLQNDRLRLSTGFSRPPRVVTLTTQHRFRSPVLAALERGLFEDDAKPVPNDGCVDLVVAPGPLAEMTWVARRIRELVKGGACGYDDIAVMFRNLGSARRRIAEVFDAHGIPAFIDERQPALHTAPARAAVALLRLLRPSARARDALALLRSPLVPGLRADADSLDMEARARGIESASALLEGAAALLGDTAPLSLAVGRLEPLLASRGPRAAAGWSAFIRDGFIALGAEQARRDDVALFLTHQDEWTQLEEFLDLLAAQGEAPMPAQDFEDALSELLTSGTSGEVPRQGGCVLVADVFHSRLPEVRFLFLPCLQQNTFPAPVRPNSLLSDLDRKAIETATGKSMPLSESRYDEEYYFYYVAVTRASERLFLSRSLRDGDGGVVAPSPFLHATVAVIDGLEARPVDSLALPGVGGACLDLEDLDARIARAFWRQESGDADRAWASALYGARLEHASSPWALAARGTHLAALERPALHLSPTQMERFADCPFKHFAQDTLRIGEPKEADFGRLQDGDLLDRVATAFLSAQKERGGLAALGSVEALETGLQECMDQVLRDVYGGVEHRPLWKARVPALRAALARFAAQLWTDWTETRWEPSYFQLAFGARRAAAGEDRASTNDPLQVTAGAHTLEFEGRMDRVDVRDGSARVLDYKRGRKSAPDRAYAEGTLLQVAVYRLALEALFRQPVEDCGHYSFRDAELQSFGKKFAKVAEEAGAESIDAFTRARVAQLGARMAGGEIGLKPLSTASCTHCAFPGVCRIDQWRRALAAGEEETSDE